MVEHGPSVVKKRKKVRKKEKVIKKTQGDTYFALSINIQLTSILPNFILENMVPNYS